MTDDKVFEDYWLKMIHDFPASFYDDRGSKEFHKKTFVAATKRERGRIESILQDRHAELYRLLGEDNSDICCEHYETGRKEIVRLLKEIQADRIEQETP